MRFFTLRDLTLLALIGAVIGFLFLGAVDNSDALPGNLSGEPGSIHYSRQRDRRFHQPFKTSDFTEEELPRVNLAK